MSDISSFEHLFSSLTPINASGHHGSPRHGSPLFGIKLREGQPFIELTDAARKNVRMTPAETRLRDEIRRLSGAREMFADVPTLMSRGVSLWENAYLVNLIDAEIEIAAPDGQPLARHDSAAVVVLVISMPEDGRGDAGLTLEVRADGLTCEAPVFLDDTRVLCGHEIHEVKSVGVNYSKIGSLVEKSVGRSYLEAFLTLFLTFVDNVIVEADGIPARRIATAEHSVPTLFLEKIASDKALYLRTGVTVESVGETLPPGFVPTRVASVSDSGRVTVRPVEGCDISERTDRLEALILKSAPDRTAKREVYRDGDFFIVPESTAGPFLLKCLPQVLEDFRLVGSDKLKAYQVVAAAPRLNLSFSSGIDFLEGEGDVEIGGEHFTISDILRQYAQKRYVKLSDGNRSILDEKYISRLQRLFRNRDKEGRIRVTIFDLPEIEELIQQKIKGDFATRTRAVLEGFNRLKKAPKPECHVNARLRAYQDEGVKWLRYLYDNSLGGCLADDMGLGKTLQTIALLSTIYPGSDKPALVVMPRSLLFNWEKELDRFCPAISHSTYYGPDRNLEEALRTNVVLTTYAIVRNDIMKLKDTEFECVVLDESQNIKNYASQTTAAVQLLDSPHRFALSGTPMENNLTELYSLFRFLNPQMFGTIDDFNTSYTYPIQRNGDKDASDSLRRRIFPFILRRLKRDVLADLPDRIDQTIYVEMSDRQRQLYNERRLSYRQQIGETIAREGVQKSQFVIFQALNELRRIASVPESVSDGLVASAKIEELVESMISSVSNGHKTVVFFNFIAGLEIVATRLEKLGIVFETMTGSTTAQARKRVVERFQTDPECMVVLLTLKVGGVGLNLTAADTVYIVEPWWNKAAEEQAINRLHRIGQKSTVNSYSLITVGTIEEKILQLQQQKSELFNELISSDTASSKHLSEKDIEFILS